LLTKAILDAGDWETWTHSGQVTQGVSAVRLLTKAILDAGDWETWTRSAQSEQTLSGSFIDTRGAFESAHGKLLSADGEGIGRRLVLKYFSGPLKATFSEAAVETAIKQSGKIDAITRALLTRIMPPVRV
jgi:hypothetical protein